MMKNKLKEEEFIELLTEEEICELHEAFNIFDIDSDGSIETSQLSMLMNSLKQYPTKEELSNIVKEIDIDNTNQIYFNQFLRIMAKRLKSGKDDEEKKLKRIFMSLDRNNNGLISIHEIRYIVTHSTEELNEKHIEMIMKEVDTDGDGLISYEEFTTIMKN